MTAAALLGAGRVNARDGQQPETVMHVRAELISEAQAVVPGRPFRVGLYMAIDRGWHINWKNPGDAGLAPRFAWRLPAGWSAGEIQWPCPELIREPSLASYGYAEEILLPVTISPPSDLRAGDTILLPLEADWLECSDVCIPGRANLQLTLPVAAGDVQTDPRWTWLESIIRERMPVPLAQAGGSASAELTDREIILRFERQGMTPLDSVLFFAGLPGQIDYAAPQVWKVEGDVLTVRVARSKSSEDDPKSVEGVLHVLPGWGGPGMPKAIAVRAMPSSAGTAGWPRWVRTLILLALVVSGGRMIQRRRQKAGAKGARPG